MTRGVDDSSNRRGEERAAAFARLVAEAQACRACPRMEGRRRLLSAANGPLRPQVCFIAEAPGRLGGERTAVPLAGDQSGRNFDRLLAAAGLDRAELFITNAVLCNPRDHRGRNAPPTALEIGNCSGFLAATLDLLQPPIVVTLGAVALRALALLEPHGLVLARDAGRVAPWRGRWLVPLYHPGPRAQIHRSFEQQAADFRRLGEIVRHREQAGRAASQASGAGARLMEDHPLDRREHAARREEAHHQRRV